MHNNIRSQSINHSFNQRIVRELNFIYVYSLKHTPYLTFSGPRATTGPTTLVTRPEKLLVDLLLVRMSSSIFCPPKDLKTKSRSFRLLLYVQVPQMLLTLKPCRKREKTVFDRSCCRSKFNIICIPYRQQASHLLLIRTNLGYGTVLTAVSARQGCSATHYYYVLCISMLICACSNTIYISAYTTVV
jgi:hypothetical protein